MLVLQNFRAVEFHPPRVYDNFDAVIDGDLILASGPGCAGAYIDSADRVIDGRGKLLMPGLVCSHHHYYSGLSRGITASIGPTPDFISILKQLWWRLDRSLTEEAVYYSSIICSIDAVRCGTTSVADHHASPSCIEGSLAAVRRGFEDTGLRGLTCYEITDRNGGMKEIEEGLKENLSHAGTIDSERRDGTWKGLSEAAIGAHAPFTVPDEGLSMISDAVHASGRGIHMHVAEDRYDVAYSHHLYGKGIAVRLDEFGLLNEKAVLVHGVHLSAGEVDLLNSRNAFLIHNARSNMNNHVGYNPSLPDVRNLALGTDGIGADMFEEFKMAYFKHKDAGGPLWPGDFLRFLAQGNELMSRYFHKPFGSLAPGNTADLVISDYMSPTPLTDDNIAGHMAFGMGAHDVRTVIINGNIVMEDREFPFDIEDIYRKAAETAAQMWKYMDTIGVRN